eukprot:gene5619-biopygen4251
MFSRGLTVGGHALALSFAFLLCALSLLYLLTSAIREHHRPNWLSRWSANGQLLLLSPAGRRPGWTLGCPDQPIQHIMWTTREMGHFAPMAFWWNLRPFLLGTQGLQEPHHAVPAALASDPSLAGADADRTHRTIGFQRNGHGPARAASFSPRPLRGRRDGAAHFCHPGTPPT